MSKIRVAVVFGGVSSEHDVSLVSATNVIENIPQDKYEVMCIGITKKGRWLYYPAIPPPLPPASGSGIRLYFRSALSGSPSRRFPADRKR